MRFAFFFFFWRYDVWWEGGVPSKVFFNLCSSPVNGPQEPDDTARSNYEVGRLSAFCVLELSIKWSRRSSAGRDSRSALSYETTRGVLTWWHLYHCPISPRAL